MEISKLHVASIRTGCPCESQIAPNEAFFRCCACCFLRQLRLPSHTPTHKWRCNRKVHIEGVMKWRQEGKVCWGVQLCVQFRLHSLLFHWKIWCLRQSRCPTLKFASTNFWSSASCRIPCTHSITPPPISYHFISPSFFFVGNSIACATLLWRNMSQRGVCALLL